MAAETKHITLEWRDALTFAGGEPDGPSIVIDADNAAAPGPMLLLLLAAASCSAADVVLILQKMRVELAALRISAEGERAPTDPKRYVRLRLRYFVAGTGLDEAKARRAIDLSLEKYCSVINGLSLDAPVEYALELG